MGLRTHECVCVGGGGRGKRAQCGVYVCVSSLRGVLGDMLGSQRKEEEGCNEWVLAVAVM